MERPPRWPVPEQDHATATGPPRRHLRLHGNDLRRVVKEPGQNSPVHIAPASAGEELPAAEVTDRAIFVTDRGAGFGDAETNRLVETAAMRVAIDTFAGWEAHDVSGAKCGWDITFRRHGLEHHVEVKGVSGQKPRVLLTHNEVAAARHDPFWRLLVVTRALITPQWNVFEREIVLAQVSPYVYTADLS